MAEVTETPVRAVGGGKEGSQWKGQELLLHWTRDGKRERAVKDQGRFLLGQLQDGQLN